MYPSSTQLIESCKERFEIENKNNDLQYKSFQRGFMNGFLQYESLVKKTCSDCEYGCLTDDDICPIEKSLRETANKFDSKKHGCSIWEIKK